MKSSRPLPSANGGWIADHFGSRKGLLLTVWYRLRYQLGGYRCYRNIDWGAVQRLVFVCKGNICRSAFAEQVARRQGFDAISCGLDTRDGLPANSDAIRAAELRGFDLSKHRTRPIVSLELMHGDLLLAMEPWQADCLQQRYGNDCQYTLTGIWGGGQGPFIKDPFGGTPEYFSHCFGLMEKSVHGIVSQVRQAKTS